VSNTADQGSTLGLQQLPVPPGAVVKKFQRVSLPAGPFSFRLRFGS
jgi:hypothetical protein